MPDESLFCLSCGARLPRAEPLTPVNSGDGATRAVPVTVPRTTPPGGKQAYALSFGPLPDERLRYRVARWVCEVAPVHQLAEVQEGLQRGEFATFLALTAEEAETARQRIQALGVHAAALRLAPAGTADLVAVTREAREAGERTEWTLGQKILVVAVTFAALLVFGIVVRLRYG